MGVSLTVDAMLFPRPDTWVLSSGSRPPNFIPIHTLLLALSWLSFPLQAPPCLGSQLENQQVLPPQLVPSSQPKGLRASWGRTFDPGMC